MQKKSMSVMEMGRILGLKKTAAFWLANKGYFEMRIIAGKRRVMVDSFENWYSQQFHYKKVDGTPPGIRWRDTISVPELAEILGVSSGVAYSIAQNPMLHTHIINNVKRIRKADFEAWYSSQSRYTKVNKGDD